MNTDDGEEEKGTTTSIGNPLPPSPLLVFVGAIRRGVHSRSRIHIHISKLASTAHCTVEYAMQNASSTV